MKKCPICKGKLGKKRMIKVSAVFDCKDCEDQISEQALKEG